MGFTPVKSGSRLQISAEEWNMVRQFCFDFNPKSTPTVRVPVRYPRIKNFAGESVPRFGVLRILSSLYDSDVGTDAMRRINTNIIELQGCKPRNNPDDLIAVMQRECEPKQIESCIIAGATQVWVNVIDVTHTYANPVEGSVYCLESAESGSCRLVVPPDKIGLQILPAIINVKEGVASEKKTIVHEKELFPAITLINPDNEIVIVCPGGLSNSGYTDNVHVINVTKNEVSTKVFPNLPVAMGNMGGLFIDGRIVLAPGDTDDHNSVAQILNLADSRWSQTPSKNNFAGCPVYIGQDNRVVIAGGYNNYYHTDGTPYYGSGLVNILYYNFFVSPFWTIDSNTGNVTNRPGATMMVRSSSIDVMQSNTITGDRQFLKKNFSGIVHIDNSPVDGQLKHCEFIAVGGNEHETYMPNAVVTYGFEDDAYYGAYVDTTKADTSTGKSSYNYGSRCKLFPDTPFPFGECQCLEYENKIIAIGGRHKDNDGEIIHDEIWTLDLNSPNAVWQNNFAPPMPTPRYNFAATFASVEGETHLFVIGGHGSDGLLKSIESLNLNSKEWKTDWKDL
jgi:hypothetical protein